MLQVIQVHACAFFYSCTSYMHVDTTKEGVALGMQSAKKSMVVDVPTKGIYIHYNYYI